MRYGVAFAGRTPRRGLAGRPAVLAESRYGHGDERHAEPGVWHVRRLRGRHWPADRAGDSGCRPVHHPVLGHRMCTERVLRMTRTGALVGDWPSRTLLVVTGCGVEAGPQTSGSDACGHDPCTCGSDPCEGICAGNHRRCGVGIGRGHLLAIAVGATGRILTVVGTGTPDTRSFDVNAHGPGTYDFVDITQNTVHATPLQPTNSWVSQNASGSYLRDFNLRGWGARMCGDAVVRGGAAYEYWRTRMRGPSASGHASSSIAKRTSGLKKRLSQVSPMT